MGKINFLMGLHCHQPVDNLRNIFEEAYKKSYEPFLSVLEKHPKIKLSLHYSGSLLDWIIEEKQDFIGRLKRLLEKKQIEILTGGYFEPIFTMIPPCDAKGQIEMLNKFIEKNLNVKPCGIWLTERVWDPEIRCIFRELGIKYTIVDDFHLKRAGLKDGEVFGHYAVRAASIQPTPPDNGFEDFFVFASIEKLRYTMPFMETDVTIDFLRKLREKENVRSVTFGDDCEKFGFWPHTYNWVYKKGWLDRFFTQLEENDWIRTMTFTEALAECAPLGKVAIPHSSYREMTEWCNGSFNNCFNKYPESDLMRKRMLLVSEKLKESERNEEAKKELYKSQSNCAYWHGIFSGIYTNYLRQGVYSHIIKAEELLEGEKTEEVEMIRLKNNPKNIIIAKNRHLTLFISPDYAGSIFELDYKPRSYNLVNTMSRRYEPYHEKLKKRPLTSKMSRVNVEDLKRRIDREAVPVDLYEVLGVRERHLDRFLNYDPYQKFSALCYVMDLKTSLSDFIESKHLNPDDDNLLGPYKENIDSGNERLVINLQRDSSRLRLNKCFILEKDAEIFMRFDLENTSLESIKFIFGVEFNWSIEDRFFLERREKRRIRNIALADRFSGLKISHIFAEPVSFWSFPVYTLNETERGICKAFQEISILFYKKLALARNSKFSLETKVKIS